MIALTTGRQMKLKSEKYKGFPPAYGNCKCSCHSSASIIHFVPCCGPKEKPIKNGKKKTERHSDGRHA
jgi:hypothetical protein